MHDRRQLPWLDGFSRDLRYALRSLRRSPAFTIVALLSLSVAIGASTTIFSVVNAVLLKPLPFRSPEQLVLLSTGMSGQTPGRPAYGTVLEWRRRSQSFSDIAVRDPASVTWTTSLGAERITVLRVSPNLFPLLGIQPVQGRILSEDDAEQRRRVAVISHRMWQTRFGGASSVIGTSIVLDGLPRQIVGILPATLGDAEVWEPQTLFPDWETRRSARGAGSWFVVGRLRPNVTVAQAQAEMSAISRGLDEELPPAEQSRSVSVIPLKLSVVGRTSQLVLWVLLGGVSCLLLIAITNVASLSLARSVGRAREIAMRSALGASPARIVRPLLAESMALAAISGCLSVLLAIAGIRLTQALGPAGLARLGDASFDWRAAGWTLVISLFTGLLIGLAPAVTVLRGNVCFSNLEGGRSVSVGVAARGVRRSLVVGEFALAVVLLAGAGLLVRSWLLLQRVELGFEPEGVLSMQVSTTGFSNPAQRADFYARALERVEAIAGVESAGIIGDLFISSDQAPIVTAEHNAGVVTDRVRLRADEVSRNLFVTLGTPLLRGRFFSGEDSPDSTRVAIVNEAMADHLWPGLDPVGRRFKLGPPDSSNAWLTVVGVVGNMRRQGLEIEPIDQMFVPFEQDPSRLATLLVRTSFPDPLKIAGSVQTAVREVERYAPLYDVTTLENRLGNYLTLRRFQTTLLIGFSMVALFLAAIGIYGMTHYSVATRTREIGIRMAVGAQANAIFRMVVSEGLKLSFTGLVLGLTGTLLLGGVTSSLLFGVTATDPLTFTIVSVLFIAVAVAACYFPARRAMKVEPIVALRQG